MNITCYLVRIYNNNDNDNDNNNNNIIIINNSLHVMGCHWKNKLEWYSYTKKIIIGIFPLHHMFSRI